MGRLKRFILLALVLIHPDPARAACGPGGGSCGGGGLTIRGEPVYQYLAKHALETSKLKGHVQPYLEQLRKQFPEFVEDLESTFETRQWYLVDQAFVKTLPIEKAEFPLDAEHSIWNDGKRVFVQSELAKDWTGDQWRRNVFHELVWSRLQDLCSQREQACNESNAYSVEELFADDKIPNREVLYRALSKNGFGTYPRPPKLACDSPTALKRRLEENPANARISNEEALCLLTLLSRLPDQSSSLQSKSPPCKIVTRRVPQKKKPVSCGSLKLRSVEVGTRCLTSSGAIFERVERDGFQEAWLGPDGNVWSDLISYSVDSTYGAQSACRAIGGVLPTMADFKRGETYGIYEVLPNMDNWFWSDTEVTSMDSFFGKASLKFNGVDASSNTVGGANNSVRCIAPPN